MIPGIFSRRFKIEAARPMTHQGVAAAKSGSLAALKRWRIGMLFYLVSSGMGQTGEGCQLQACRMAGQAQAALTYLAKTALTLLHFHLIFGACYGGKPTNAT